MSKADRAGPQLRNQVAGVGMPKRLRRPANRFLALAGHPIVSDAIAAALVAGAGALAQRKGKSDVAKAAGLGAAAAAVKASKGANRLTVALAIALAEVGIAALARRNGLPKRG